MESEGHVLPPPPAGASVFLFVFPELHDLENVPITSKWIKESRNRRGYISFNYCPASASRVGRKVSAGLPEHHLILCSCSAEPLERVVTTPLQASALTSPLTRASDSETPRNGREQIPTSLTSVGEAAFPRASLEVLNK